MSHVSYSVMGVLPQLILSGSVLVHAGRKPSLFWVGIMQLARIQLVTFFAAFFNSMYRTTHYPEMLHTILGGMFTPVVAECDH